MTDKSPLGFLSYIFEHLLDFIFPRSCVGCGHFGTYICSNCYTTIQFLELPLCPGCMKSIPHLGVHRTCQTGTYLNGLVALTHHTGVISTLIHNLKYQGFFDMTRPLATLASPLLYKMYAQKKIQAFIPIPLHISKLNERGFNQTEILSLELSKILKIPTRTNLVKREKKTASQIQLSKAKRIQNLKDAFVCTGRFPKGATLLLIDDVSTTGSTLNNCAKALKNAGASAVYGFVIAHGK